MKREPGNNIFHILSPISASWRMFEQTLILLMLAIKKKFFCYQLHISIELRWRRILLLQNLFERCTIHPDEK